MSQSVNQKEFLIVSLINTSTSAVLAFAFISYFINKKYKGFAVSLITLSIMIDILTRFFTKQDQKNQNHRQILKHYWHAVFVIILFTQPI